jgi:hypothetical protein
MCSFDTTHEDVDNLVAILKESVESCRDEVHHEEMPATVS